MSALLATRIERLKPRHGAPARPLGLLASIEAARTGAPRHRRAVTSSADFDSRRRWLIVAAAGLFGLSVMLLGLLQAGAGDARPGNAAVAAASPLTSPPASLPLPAAEPPAPAAPVAPVPVTINRPRVATTNPGFTSAKSFTGFPFFGFMG